MRVLAQKALIPAHVGQRLVRLIDIEGWRIASDFSDLRFVGVNDVVNRVVQFQVLALRAVENAAAELLAITVNSTHLGGVYWCD